MNNSSRSGGRQPVDAWICLGGNIGDRHVYLKRAKDLIARRAGKITRTSSVYETEGWGTESPNKFLNQVIGIETTMDAHTLLSELLSVEQSLGRERTAERNGDRVIDIDLLFFGRAVIRQQGIEVPHPRLHLRRFVLVPLSEAAPELVHPVTGETVNEMLSACQDQLPVCLSGIES